MRDCVVCLPLTLPPEVGLGLTLTPFVVSMVSRLTGLGSVCCLNLTGMRYKGLRKVEINQRSLQFQRLMERLGTPIDHYWADSENSHTKRLQKYCDDMVASGQLQSRVTSRLICKCGAVEIIEGAVNPALLKNHKVIQQQDRYLSCKLCGETLESIHGPSLLLESRFIERELNVYPTFYQKEIVTLRSEYDQPLLVSRHMKGDTTVSLFGRRWRLDTDFCWSLLFCSLLDEGLRPAVVVVSNRSLKPLVWSLGISCKLTSLLQDVSIVVTPYIRTQARLDSAKWNVRQSIDRYGSPSIRLLLGSTLKWDQKEVTLDSSVIFWGLKALARSPIAIPSPHETYTLPEALKLMGGDLVEQFVTDMRKADTVQLSSYRNLLLGKVNQ